MPHLSYPFLFECTNCETETAVRRSEAQNLNHDPESMDAVLMALDDQGWLRDEEEQLLLCPACAEDV